MPTIPELEAIIQQLQQELAEAQIKARSFFQHGKLYAQKLQDHFTPLLTSNHARLQALTAQWSVASKADWSSNLWQDWEPQSVDQWQWLRYGSLLEQRSDNDFSFPAYAPFIGENKTIIIKSEKGAAKLGEALLQSLLVRTALMLPHQASYTLLDPAGNGTAFPMRKFLPQVRPNSDDVRRDLDQVIAEIRRIIETYLDASVTSFELIPEDIRVNERFHFVFAADFPNKYDRRAIEALQSIGNTGPRAGTYLFIHYNQEYELPRDMGLDGFKNIFYLDAAAKSTTVDKLDFKLTPDSTPPAPLQEQLFAKLSAATPVERKLDWDEVVALKESEWWQGNSSSIIETPVGKRGNKDFLKIWFGEDKEGRPCVHGILGAMPGAGKSSLYHELIAGLATRYSPEELRFYLIDGKYGVEFQPYTRLPHAEVVSLKTSAELSRSVLAELVGEMERRNAIFARTGVASLTAYRAKGQPEGKLPRLVLIVDEYQQLFEGDRDGLASTYLRQLSQQGRSAGIHLLLASQRFGAAGMLNQNAIFGNIHLRMALQMSETDVRALTEFGPRGKALILSTCNMPGKIVINDRAGDDNANLAGKAAYLSSQRRDEILQCLEEKAQTLPEDSLPKRVVFNGDAQPDLIDNPHLFSLLQRETWLTAEELESYARRPIQAGGLNIADWFVAEHPYVTWLGQEFNVRGQAAIVVRRRNSENVALVGSTNAARYGMLAAILIGISLNASPKDTRFVVVDRSIPGSQWHQTLPKVCEDVLRPAGFSVEFTQDERSVNNILNTLLEEMDRRRSLDEKDRSTQPAIFVMFAEPNRVDTLRRRSDTYGMTDSPDGVLLRRLYTEGAPLGIHVLISTDSVGSLLSVIDERRGLVHFRHRVALQMSEEDSHKLVRSRKASQLQLEGSTPIRALYLDVENDKVVRFKPYSIEANAESLQGTLAQQLDRIAAILAERAIPA
jgi:DNA segregation ATPase FtsK/SpoIIIE, S-DNA-T family